MDPSKLQQSLERLRAAPHQLLLPHPLLDAQALGNPALLAGVLNYGLLHEMQHMQQGENSLAMNLSLLEGFRNQQKFQQENAARQLIAAQANKRLSEDLENFRESQRRRTSNDDEILTPIHELERLFFSQQKRINDLVAALGEQQNQTERMLGAASPFYTSKTTSNSKSSTQDPASGEDRSDSAAVNAKKPSESTLAPPLDTEQHGRDRRSSSTRRSKTRSWTPDEIDLLYEAIKKFGRQWSQVAKHVGTRSEQDCRSKVQKEVANGNMREPAGKRIRTPWTVAETRALADAVRLYPNNWYKIAEQVQGRSRDECVLKASREVITGRLVLPTVVGSETIAAACNSDDAGDPANKSADEPAASVALSASTTSTEAATAAE